MADTSLLIHVDQTDALDRNGAEGKELLDKVIDHLQALRLGTRRANSIKVWPDGADPVAASATVTCAAVANADTVTVNGTALTAVQHHSRATVTCASVQAADTVTVHDVVFTASSTPTGTDQWEIDGDDTADAAALVAKINAHPDLSGIVTAANAAGVVTVRAVEAGTGGDSIVLESSDGTRLLTSDGNLANGAAIGNNEFDFGGTDAQTATALALAINSSTTDGVEFMVSASVDDDVVTVTALQPGIAGNAITLASSDAGRLAVSAARLASGAGGTAVDPITITL